MKTFRFLLLSLTLASALVWVFAGIGVATVVSGCAGVSGVKLDPAGPSHGDAVRYDFKLAIVTQHKLLQTFLDWERDNAPLLVNQPRVHELAEKIRSDGPGWFKAADEKLQAYEALATAATSDAPTLERARRALLAALALIQAEQARASATMIAAATLPEK